jgi:hypothetical protein
MGRTKFSTSTALALAAVLLSSSTAVYAVASLPKHSVGKKQLKKAAVTNKKIAPGAVSGSKIAPNTVLSASRLTFGKGNATSVPATMVLSLPRVHVTVTTDGNADTTAEVEVNLPMITGPSPQWYINSSGNSGMYSTYGGRQELTPVTATREFTANIWRNDASTAIYLHCAFDVAGFSGARPFSCWAMST